MREAADALDISQPSVSKQLVAMERSLGGELFLRRRGERARLSPFGLSILADARRAISAQQRLSRDGGAANHRETVRQVFVRPFMLDQVKERLGRLHEAGLSANIKFVVVDDAEDIAVRVAANRDSLAVLRSGSLFPARDVVQIVLREETASVYVSADLAQQIASGQVRPTDLPVLIPPGSPAFHAWVASILPGTGFDGRNIEYGPQFVELLKEEIVGGKGASVFMDWHMRELVEDGSLVALAPLDCPLRLLLLAHGNIAPTELSSFANLFREI
jgi:DNA-binding transcriptional LysR family regulator